MANAKMEHWERKVTLYLPLVVNTKLCTQVALRPMRLDFECVSFLVSIQIPSQVLVHAQCQKSMSF